MKKLVAVFFIFSFATGFAQDADIIKKDFQTIVNFTRAMNLPEVMDMTYPRLFEIFSKEQMVSMTQAIMQGAGIPMIPLS